MRTIAIVSTMLLLSCQKEVVIQEVYKPVTDTLYISYEDSIYQQLYHVSSKDNRYYECVVIKQKGSHAMYLCGADTLSVFFK